MFYGKCREEQNGYRIDFPLVGSGTAVECGQIGAETQIATKQPPCTERRTKMPV